MDWIPEFEPVGPGTYRVTNIRYPDDTVGCVSCDYPDGKWRITRDTSDMTFPRRQEAARAERMLAHNMRFARASPDATIALAITIVRLLAVRDNTTD